MNVTITSHITVCGSSLAKSAFTIEPSAIASRRVEVLYFISCPMLKAVMSMIMSWSMHGVNELAR